VRLAIAFGIVVLVAITTTLGFRERFEGSLLFPAVASVGTLCVAPFAAWQAHRDGVLGKLYTPKGGDFALGFGLAFLLFGAAHFVTKTVMPLGTPRSVWLLGLYEQIGDPAALRSRVFFVVVFLFVSALADESVWRFYVPRLLEDVVGSRRAWAVSIPLYTLAHVGTGLALARHDAGFNPLVVLAALALGTVWSVLTRVLGRLAPAVFSHVLFNLATLVLFRLYGPSV